jgi:very-short-patch-repair endonuclease
VKAPRRGGRLVRTPAERAFRRELRRIASPAERRLWEHLRRAGLGARFGRQRLVGGVTVGFWCPSRNLAVEVDEPTTSASGRRRESAALAALGVRVLRFSATQVLTDLETVLNTIAEAVDGASAQTSRQAAAPLAAPTDKPRPMAAARG